MRHTFKEVQDEDEAGISMGVRYRCRHGMGIRILDVVRVLADKRTVEKGV